MNIAHRFFSFAVLAALLMLPALLPAHANRVPQRVARLSLVHGNVSLAPAGSQSWLTARANRPLIRGDRLYTGDDSRAVVQLGGAVLRLDERSAVELMALGEDRVQVRVTQGTVNLAVRRLDSDEIYEVDTPALAFVAERPGSYRIDLDPDDYGAMVTVFSGRGSVWDMRNNQRTVASGRSYRFDGRSVDNISIRAIPARNGFDRFCAELDARYAGSSSLHYVSPSVLGYRDLDRYGSWQRSSAYGSIWFPSHVSVGWVPYSHGRWSWIQPWGWTWVSASPWGFAPFHYGRWAFVHDRWGWVPGPRLRTAVFAPALVAFVGNLSISIGGAAPVAWFPLGPRDIYRPPYQVTENYFININLGSGRFFQRHAMRGHWHDYRGRHHRQRRFDYAYRNDPWAVTMVPRDDFRSARLVQRSEHNLSQAVLRRGRLEGTPDIQPNTAGDRAGAARVRPHRDVFARPVVAHTPVESPHVIRHAQAPRAAPRHAAVAPSREPTPVRRTLGSRQRPAASPRGRPQVERHNARPQPERQRAITRSVSRPMSRPKPIQQQPTPSVSRPERVRRPTRNAPRGVPRAPQVQRDRPAAATHVRPRARPEVTRQRPARPAPRASRPVRAAPHPSQPARQRSQQRPQPSPPRARPSPPSRSDAKPARATPRSAPAPRGRPARRAAGGRSMR